MLAGPGRALADAPAAWQADPAHSGLAQGTTFAPPLGKRWVRRDLGDDVGFPVMAEGKVFVTAGGSLYALDRTSGATLWSRSLNAPGVAYDAGRVFAVDASGVMQALSAATGELIWSSQLEGTGGRFAPPVATRGYVYAASDYGVYGVRQADGIVVWSGDSNSGHASPAVDGDHVYTGSGCNVQARQPETGVQLWNTQGGCSSGGFSGLVAGSAVYAGTSGAGVLLDPLTGMVRDSYAAYSPPALSGGVAFFKSAHDVFARTEQTGLVKWRHPLEQDRLALPPLVAAGYVYAVDPGDNLMALATGTGQVAWERRLEVSDLFLDEEKSRWPGMAAAGDTLVVASHGRVTAFAPGADTPGVDDPDKPSGVGLELSLAFKPKSTVFGRAVQLEGRFTGRGGGSDGKVELQADPWPYGTWENRRKVESFGGFIRTTVRPDRNTRYRLVLDSTAPPVVSPTRQVFTNFFEHFTVRGRSRRSVSVRITLRGPRDLKLAGRRIFVYHYRRHARSAVRIGALRLRRRGRAAFARGALHTPPLRSSDLFFTCLREPRDDGFGKPARALRFCGRRRL